MAIKTWALEYLLRAKITEEIPAVIDQLSANANGGLIAMRMKCLKVERFNQTIEKAPQGRML
ncbi:MAG: hypothetical protein ACKOUT_08210 [Novosphingobium sp.]